MNYAIDPIPYIIFMGGFIAPAVICWIYSFCELVYPKSKGKVFYPYLLICLIYEILFFIFIIMDPSLIAIYEGRFSYRRTLFNIFINIFAILKALITGLIFTLKSMKSESDEFLWKGRFFLIGIISFVGASIFDIFSGGNIVLQVIVRNLLIKSAVEYYFGFFLPNLLAKRLID